MLKRSLNEYKPYFMIIVMMLFLSFFVDMQTEKLLGAQFYAIIIISVLLLILFRKYLSFDLLLWIMNGGVFIKICYVCYTAIWTRQHDVIDFHVGEGHAAYIEYILYNKHLPDFDPTSVWAFFQPPLHHMISAVWMWAGIRLGIVERQIQENIQVLTLAYMCIVLLVTMKIIKELKLSQQSQAVAMLIVAFHPIFTLLSGSINNDALALSLSVMALFLTMRWYEKPSYLNTAVLAIVIGLSMMAKLSSALIAPAIGVVMLMKAWGKWKEFIPKFMVFGVLVAPIGLFWSVRNYILFKTPINYIPEVGEQLKHTSFFDRVLDVSLSSVYPSLISNGDAYDEYNVLLAMIKTSLFGEYNYGNLSRWVTPVAVVLFISAIILIVVSLFATVKVIINKDSSMTLWQKVLFGGTYICYLVGYLSFALGYSNFSAQDFRYAAIIIVIEAVFLGVYYDCAKHKKFIMITAAVFAVTSFLTYFLIGV